MKTKILKLMLISILTQSSAFAAFNTFQCTSKKIQITKRMPFKETIEYKDLLSGNPPELIDIEHATWPADTEYRGSKQTFSFRIININGNNLYNLVITENSPNSDDATATLFRANEDGLFNDVVERKLNCLVE